MKKLLGTIILSLLIVSINSRHFKRHSNKNLSRNCTNCKQRCSRHNHEINPLEKSDIVVTFVANTNFISPNESSHVAEVDPFDKIIQSIFSSFIQGLTSGMQYRQNISKNNDDNETFKVNGSFEHFNKANFSTTADFTSDIEDANFTNETEKVFIHDGGSMKCFQKHCLTCGNSLNTTTTSLELQDDFKSVNRTLENLNNTKEESTNISTTTVKLDHKNNIERRHYFLSISGGTENSTTAKHTSDAVIVDDFPFQFLDSLLNSQNKFSKNSKRIERGIIDKLLVEESNIHRVKRKPQKLTTPTFKLTVNPNTGNPTTVSGEVITGDIATNQEDTTKKGGKEDTTKKGGKVNKNKKDTTTTEDTTTEDTTTTEDDEVTIDNSTDEDVDLPDDSDHLSPSPGITYTKNSYLYTVTIPIFIGFILLISGMCICFRTSGRCCNLFLTDPTKVIAQQKATKDPVAAAALAPKKV